jgi:mannose-1-phosphate guanylyltransferase
MTQVMQNRWAVVLAGGDGSRLRPLTQMLAGDERPKQFCRILGRTTLLGETVDRLARIVSPEQTVFVLSQRHEVFYRDELATVPRARLVEQPINRGTTAAVIAALFRIRNLTDDDPVVGLFPSDHYYADRESLDHALTAAFSAAARPARPVVLVGARATGAETDFGWIEPGDVTKVRGRRPAGVGRLHRVGRFVEKPSADVASQLFQSGGWWNTFISVGRVSAFSELLADTVPDIWASFAAVLDPKLGRQANVANVTRVLYATVPMSDFSRDVLAARPDRLAVIGPLDAGWTDLGQPHRVLDTMARRGVPRPSLLRRVAG